MKIRFKSEYEDRGLIYNHCLKTEQTQQDYRPHYHDLYEILFVRDGDISHLTEDAVWPIRKNSLVFVRPGVQHCIRVDRDTPYDRYDLLFQPDALCPGLLEKIPEDVHVVSFESNQLVIQLFEKLDYYCQSLEKKDLGRVLRALTEELLLNILLQLQAARSSGDIQKHPLTLQAAAYIEENLLTLTDIGTVCRSLGISRSYLYQLFREDLRTTPKHYILQRRLNLARQELFLGASATSVSAQCGFSDYSTFFRAYKRHFGYAPTETHHASVVRTSAEDMFLGHEASPGD